LSFGKGGVLVVKLLRVKLAIRTFLWLTLLLILILGAVTLIGQVVRYIPSQVGSIDSDVAMAIIATAIAGFASVFTVVYAQWRTKVREIAEAHRPQKVKVYGGYMELMFAMLQQTKKEEPKKGKVVTPKAIPGNHLDKMYSFRREVILWASPGVIRAYLEWESISAHEPDVKVRLLAWDKLLREMRKDLGNSNWMLRPGQLMHMILTPDAREELS
jgi:hypothetical protein